MVEASLILKKQHVILLPCPGGYARAFSFRIKGAKMQGVHPPEYPDIMYASLKHCHSYSHNMTYFENMKRSRGFITHMLSRKMTILL